MWGVWSDIGCVESGEYNGSIGFDKNDPLHNLIASLSKLIPNTEHPLSLSTTQHHTDSIVPFKMSSSGIENDEHAVADAYIALSDYVVEFPKEVSDYFVSKLGEEEFRKICNLACQAPP